MKMRHMVLKSIITRSPLVAGFDRIIGVVLVGVRGVCPLAGGP